MNATPASSGRPASVRPSALRKMLRLLGWLGAIVGIGAALVLGGKRLFPRKPIAVRAVAVAEGPVRDVVTSSTAGEVAPARRATVRVDIGARVTSVPKRRGDRVKQGEVVVQLDDADLAARQREARAALAVATAAVEQARARVATVERQAGRAMVAAGGQIRYGNRRRDTFVLGVGPTFADMHNMEVATGRFLAEE